MKMKPKELADYIELQMSHGPVSTKNISLCLGKLHASTVEYLKKRFKIVQSHGVFGYWRFEK